jgi:hypothetical protein
VGKDRSLVRASDIGAWAYCRRAWFLAQVKGVAHQRPEVLAAGSDAHRRHGQRVMQAGRARNAGLWLVVAGVVLVVAVALLWLFQ